MKLPEPTNTTANLIYSLYDKEEEPRFYLGMSGIGEPCERRLWLEFRFAIKQKIEPRIKRLFNTGHREEDRILNELKRAGCKVEAFDPKTGKQFEVSSCGGHFKGHLDAEITGLPEAPKTKHLVDVKTISSKNFAKLLKEGMEKLYPKYWAQAHAYMGHRKLTRAMFIFNCKDDDRITCERFDYDESVFQKNEVKAKRIIFADRIPPPLSTDPTWYQCSYCPAKDFCHSSHTTKEVNCRTCSHSTAKENSTWRCARWDDAIPNKAQLNGCDSHVLHPDLVPYQMLDSDDGINGKWLIDGKEIVNGEGGYLSSEILANPKMLGDKRVDEVRAVLGAKIVA